MWKCQTHCGDLVKNDANPCPSIVLSEHAFNFRRQVALRHKNDHIYQGPGRHFWGHLGTAPAGLPLRILDGGNGHVAMMTPKKIGPTGEWWGENGEIAKSWACEDWKFSVFRHSSQHPKKTASAPPPIKTVYSRHDSVAPPPWVDPSWALKNTDSHAYVIPCQ